MKKLPYLIAHRGCRDIYPENTLEAFQAALDIQADMIELDVAYTRDRRLVVIHDDTVDRTTNGTGLVEDFNLADLKQLDAGSWFDPELKDCRVPELREVLELVQDQMIVNVEIKDTYYEENLSTDTIELNVLDLIK